MLMANLYTLLKASEKQVRKVCRKELIANGYDVVEADDFIYAAGTVPVLLVAHYDTVLKEPPHYIRNQGGILSGKHGLGGDDRAGVYAILETIKKHHVHVLFTGGEERGAIGASAFERSGIKPEVNYIIELDRRGENDAVYYEGDNKEFEAFITEHGWVTATGSFTDICVLAPCLGVSAVNLSIGFKNEHRENETLDTKIMNRTIARLPELLGGPKFEWKEKPYSRWWNDYYRYDRYGRYDPYDYDEDFWEVTYMDPDTGTEKREWYCASSYEEAVGMFLMDYPNLTYNDVLCVRGESNYGEHAKYLI